MEPLNAARKALTAKNVERGMELFGRIETSWCWVFADRSGDIGKLNFRCMATQTGRA